MQATEQQAIMKCALLLHAMEAAATEAAAELETAKGLISPSECCSTAHDCCKIIQHLQILADA
jgi:hypothetical protein